MHASMILILIVVLIVSQVCLVQWKKWKPYSYHVCTLAGMWVIPLGISIKNHWWRFPCIWVVFFLDYFAYREESFREAYAGHHTEAGVQMVHADVQSELLYRHLWLHHHDGHLPRSQRDIRSGALRLDGRGPHVHVLRPLLRGHESRPGRDLHGEDGGQHRLLQVRQGHPRQAPGE